MRTKITTCVVIALMLLSGVSQAQKRNRAERMQKTMIKLTDAQKEELKAAKVEFAKATLDVKNELNELQAHQRTLMSAEKLDEKKVFENIDNMSALKKQLMEERVNMRLATSGLLDQEQGLNRGMKMNRRKGQMQRGNRKGQFGRGNKNGQMQSGNRNGQMKRGDGKGQMNKGNRRAFAERGNQSCSNALNLSEDQQKQMEAIRLEHRKGNQNLREEMQELRLKQKHLLNDETPNKNKVFSNLDRISKIQNELAKERVLNQKDIRKILDEDQLVLFLSKPHKMKKNRRARMQRAS